MVAGMVMGWGLYLRGRGGNEDREANAVIQRRPPAVTANTALH